MQLEHLTKREQDNLAKAVGYLEKAGIAISSMQCATKYHNPILVDTTVDNLRSLARIAEKMSVVIEKQKEIADKCKNRLAYEEAAADDVIAQHLDQGGWL